MSPIHVTTNEFVRIRILLYAYMRVRNIVSLNVVLLISCKVTCIKIVFKALSICNLHKDTLNDSEMKVHGAGPKNVGAPGSLII